MSGRTGHCLCGAISYELSSEPAMTGICHCKNCQRQAGSAYSILIGVPDDQVTIHGDLKTFVDNADSGNSVERKFCGACGSPILSETKTQPGMVFIKAGTLDDTSGLVPQFHLWCDSAFEFVEIPEGIPAMPKQ